MFLQKIPIIAALLGTDQDPNSGDCIPLPKSLPTSSPTPKDNCGDPIFANANEDRCAEPGTMVSHDIEHDIGSGSSGGGEAIGGEISGTPPQVTDAIPSGLGEMIPSIGQFSGASHSP